MENNVFPEHKINQRWDPTLLPYIAYIIVVRNKQYFVCIRQHITVREGKRWRDMIRMPNG